MAQISEAHGLPPTGLKIDVQDSMTPPCTATPPQTQEGPRLKAVPYVQFSNAGPQPFDWHDDADAVVVEHSPGIAVYTNQDGNIVVRQHDYPDDAVVIVCPKDARRVAKAIIEAGQMSGAFAAWQPQYAELGIATFPVKDKKPCIRSWQCVGLNASAELAIKFPEANAFGFQCGKRSNITVLDIDSSDPKALDQATETFGKSPVLWRTGGGNFAMPFRWAGERRRVRLLSNPPIDLIGGGYAVAPPSLGRKGQYEFLKGSLQSLLDLPKLRLPANENQPGRGEKVPVGKRADTLFRFALDQARFVDELDSLIDVVRTRNMDCEQPLSDVEVIKTASSAWGYEVSGKNLIGRGGAVVISNSVIDALIDDPDAWRLYGKLKRRHWGENFILASAMAPSMGWGARRWKDARRRLEECGLINCLHRGGRGPSDPPIYAWAQKGVLK